MYIYLLYFISMFVGEGAAKYERQADQQNIMLNNSSTISLTNDE